MRSGCGDEVLGQVQRKDNPSGCRHLGTSSSLKSRPNFTLKLVRPGFGPTAELPTSSPAPWRHAGCSSPLGFCERHWRQPARRFGFGTRDRPHSLA